MKSLISTRNASQKLLFKEQKSSFSPLLFPPQSKYLWRQIILLTQSHGWFFVSFYTTATILYKVTNRYHYLCNSRTPPTEFIPRHKFWWWSGLCQPICSKLLEINVLTWQRLPNISMDNIIAGSKRVFISAPHVCNLIVFDKKIINKMKRHSAMKSMMLWW